MQCHAIQELTNSLNVKRDKGSVDIFFLDVEGAELSVLQSIDYSKLKFEVIFVEESNIKEVISFLADHQYKHVAKVGDDHVFFRLGNKKLIEHYESICKCLREGECIRKLVYSVSNAGFFC